MSYVYFIYWPYVERADDIDLVADGKLAEYVLKMIYDGRISDDSIDEFEKKTGKKSAENDSEAIDLLQIDNWIVEKKYVNESEA